MEKDRQKKRTLQSAVSNPKSKDDHWRSVTKESVTGTF